MHEFLTIQIVTAFFFDLLLGDPPWLPHPIRVIGRAIERGEGVLRRLLPFERLSGVLLTLFIVLGTYIATYWGLSLFYQVSYLLHFIASTIILFFTLSVRSLAEETGRVVKALEAGDIGKARKELSGIVGRDTKDLDEREIIRACIETVAENTVDGIISPLVYAFLGGPALAMAYKAVNTLDSMVGYKNERYLYFGWASARLDDLANYVPARVSARLIPMSSYLCGARFKECVYITARDGRKHPSPNSGIPEAAFAGALGVQLGGPSTYGGIPSNKPLIGEPHEPLTIEKVRQSIRMAYVTSFLALGLGIILRTVVDMRI